MQDSWDEIVDVVVVGSGGGALTAALTASDGGAQVLVVEKDEYLGGTTAVSGGDMWIPNNRHIADTDNREDAIAYIHRLADGRESDPSLVEVYVDTAPEAIAYLEEHTGYRSEPHMSLDDYYSVIGDRIPGARPYPRSISPKPYPAATELGEEFASKINRGPWVPPAEVTFSEMRRGEVGPEELDAVGEPVDLVGHDWGAALTYRIATTRPELLRSWAADAAYLLHPDYVWHDLARTWQTPGAGEAFWDGYLGQPAEQVAAAFEPWGVGPDHALVLAAMADATMAGCVLDLYRASIPNPNARWTVTLSSVPGLVLDTPADPFGPQHQSLEVARTLGADVAHLDGLGHWWALQDPARVAVELSTFWAAHR